MLTAEQQWVLAQWKDLLAAAGLDRVLACDPGRGGAQVPGPSSPLIRLFGEGCAVDAHDLNDCLTGEVLATLEELDLVRRDGKRLVSAYRLVSHLGLLLFCEKVSPAAKCYYGNDSIELSRMLHGAQGNVLDLCSGVGTQALICARTAAHVTAVEIEPLAAKLFRVNAAINGLADKVELINGDLLDPIGGRRFDLISCNPPFMPVPPGVRYPRFADGGGDGLAIVRRVLAGLPDALTEDGRCEMVGAALGNSESPNLAPFKKMAEDSSLAIIVDCRTREELTGKTLEQLVMIAADGSREAVEQAFRTHFARLNATHLYCFLLHAVPAPSPMVCASFGDGANKAFWVVPFP